MNILTTIARQLAVLYPEREAIALARYVMEDRFHLSPTDIMLGKDSDLSQEDKAELQNIISRLLCGEPVQYILGETFFCGHSFLVSPACLIPRPETEDLVRLIIEDYKDRQEVQILDVGTGSGCVAISLALALDACVKVTAWDVSEDALNIASSNNKKLGSNVIFEKRDALHIGKELRMWDVIVSNPPYVSESEALQMDRNVVDYEPHLALFVPDDNPMIFYHSIGEFAFSHIRKGGSLYVEVNHLFAKECVSLFRGIGFSGIDLKKDRFDKYRMIKCKTP